MAFSKRQLVIAARLAAAAGACLFRGKARAVSWAAHDALWLYPTLRRNCSWHGPVVTRFQTSAKEVWLTIDDGPDERDTPEMLDVLARHRARATFFVIGQKVRAHPHLCRRILAEGHSLGNHTQSHPAPYWWILPRPFVHREIARCNASILSVTGSKPRWFRSPVGMTSTAVHPAAEREGLQVVGWSADGRDGCPAAPTRIIERIGARLRPGAILLLHESGRSRHRVLTLSRLLDFLAERGYRCVLPSPESLQ
ncbi:MAG TPA: polysaccharide deacetylase family protein [Terrimicrobiaceae bacterium]|nr:polysaccharide deacetylase family protein [Terrimicrobiaceae bacterium]